MTTFWCHRIQTQSKKPFYNHKSKHFNGNSIRQASQSIFFLVLILAFCNDRSIIELFHRFSVACVYQLQVESSRQMYHAVMEEVARFLERCYQSIDTIQKNGQMARSSSVNHMFIDHPHSNQPLRSDIHRISTNSLDKSQCSTTSSTQQPLNESFTSTSTTSTSNSDTYNNFTDFTW